MKVNIIGTGNVGTLLLNELKKKVVVSVFGRSQKPGVLKLEMLDLSADFTFLCVNDDAISVLSETLPRKMCLVHTSGSIPLQTLSEFQNSGVLYPLQTINSERKINIRSVPFLIEGSNEKTTELLLEFTRNNLSENVRLARSAERYMVHLAAVICNNFSTYLMGEAAEILNKQGMSAAILKPLMTETVEKFFEMGYTKSQTGPARRGDLKVIQKHLESIDNKDLKIVYEKISAEIAKRFNASQFDSDIPFGQQ